jgi:hypothetical protein
VRKRTQAKQASDARPPAPAAAPPPQVDAQTVVAVVRRNSRLGPGGRPPGQGGVGQGRRPSGIPEEGPPSRVASGTGTPALDVHRRPAHANTVGPGQQPQQFQGAARYSLADGPSPSSTPHPQPGRQGTAPPGRQQQQQQQGPASSPAPSQQQQQQQQQQQPQQPARPPVKYETFASMGIQSGKAEEKDCVIM